MYNKNFKLSLDDLDLIETSLFNMMSHCENESKARDIHELLGKLHNQKNWYRPKTNDYVGG